MTDPTPFNFEQEPRVVDEIAVLDLDRTLINTSAVADLILYSLKLYGIEDSRIDAMRIYVESQKGASFDLFTYLQTEFPDVSTESLKENILSSVTDDFQRTLLCRGADRLIYVLHQHKIPFVVLTYGEATYQDFKIRLFRRLVDMFTHEIPAIITDTKNKSDLIATEWFDDNGCLKGLVRERLGYLDPNKVVVVDDKKVNLQSSNSRITGVLIDNDSDGETDGAIPIARLADAVEGNGTLNVEAAAYAKYQSEQAS